MADQNAGATGLSSSGSGTEQILIEVAFDTGDIAAKAAEVRQNITALRAANKDLKKDVDANTKSSADSAKQLAQNEKAIRAYTADLKTLDGQLQANTSSIVATGDSYNALSAQLVQSQREYRALSAAQRDAAPGQELLSRINALKTELKDLDATQGDFQRNVGNYPKQIEAVIPGFSSLNKVLGTVGASFQSLATGGTAALKSLGTGVVAFGKLFITPPIIVITAVLSAILLVVNRVREAFNRNNDASTRLQKAFATFQPVITALNFVFDKLATAISYVVEGGVQLIDFLIRANPLVQIFTRLFGDAAQSIRDASDASRELVQAQSDLLQSERTYTVESARRNAEIAKLRDQAIDKENETADARLDALNRAIELERQNLEDERTLAAERLRILEAEAKQRKDTSDASQKAIADAQAAALNAETAYYNGTRRLRSQALAAQKEINDAEKALLKEREDAFKQAVANREAATTAEVAALRRLEDEILKTISDSTERQIRQSQVAADREIEALRKRLETEANLTVAARRAISDTIVQIEANNAIQVQRIRDEQAKRLSDQAINAEVQRLELLLQVARKGSENEYNLRVQQIEILRQQALAAENLTQQEILNINARFDQQLLDQDKVRLARQAEQQRQALLNDIEERRQLLFGQEAELAQLELEQAQLEAQRLIELDTETKAALYQNEEEYTAAVLAANKRVQASTAQTLQTQQRLAESQVAIFGAVTSAINTMFDDIAGDNAKYAGFLKILALAQASIELGLSIAAATRTAASGGDPYTVAARIIAAVAGVVGAFVSVTQSIKAAQIPEAPKFASGGIVPGRSFTGDRVPAMVNSGEMILNAQQQARLFEIANRQTSTASFDYELFAELTAEAVSNLPSPIMDYSEFTTFEQNITKYDEYASVQ